MIGFLLALGNSVERMEDEGVPLDMKTWLQQAVVWSISMLEDAASEDAPITYLFVSFVTLVFLTEVGVTAILGLQSIQVFATGLFGVHPRVAWVLSPFLHRGPSHYVANMVAFAFAGVAIERHWSKRRFAGFLLISGYLPTVAGAALMMAFSSTQVAFYGSSGMGFAMTGFAIGHLPWAHLRLTRPEWFAVGLGFLSLLTVLLDPFTGPYFHPDWINGGHATGFVIGLYAAKSQLAECDVGWV